MYRSFWLFSFSFNQLICFCFLFDWFFLFKTGLSKYSSNDKAQKAELTELGKEIVEKQKYMRKVTTKRAELISIKNELKLKSKEVDRHHENMSEEMDDSVESLENALSKFDGEAVKKRKLLRGELTSMETKNKVRKRKNEGKKK